MNATVTTQELTAESALASRIVRRNTIPREFLRWLGNPAQQIQFPKAFRVTAIEASMSELLRPLIEDAESTERHEMREGPEWFAAMAAYISTKGRDLGLEAVDRMIATSLLPLYRSLGSGQLIEGFEQTRFRFSEALAIIAACEIFKGDLVQWLNCSLRARSTPIQAVESSPAIDLVQLARLLRNVTRGFDASTGAFSEHATELLADAAGQAETTVQWADPNLLWRLSGELTARKSDIVLPRAWAETPVPWSKIAEHWRVLEHRLSSDRPTQFDSYIPSDIGPETHPDLIPSDSRSANQNTPNRSNADASLASQDAGRVASEPINGPEQKLTKQFDALEFLLSENSSIVPPSDPALANESSKHWDDDATEEIDEFSANRLEDAENELAFDREDSVGGAMDDQFECESLKKIVIAEIVSTNDSLLSNVLKRHLAICRAEDRVVALSMVVVEPDLDTDQTLVRTVRENGLTLWQQRLVNWLANHPDIEETHAFHTHAGELVVLTMDVERSMLTNLLRQGLVEVLTGKQYSELGDPSLSMVAIPGSYHGGIAAISAPSPSFGPEQLIEPAVRCLTAAKSHGSASIKSIEVY